MNLCVFAGNSLVSVIVDSDGLTFSALKHLNELITGDFFSDDFLWG